MNQEFFSPSAAMKFIVSGEMYQLDLNVKKSHFFHRETTKKCKELLILMLVVIMGFFLETYEHDLNVKSPRFLYYESLKLKALKKLFFSMIILSIIITSLLWIFI